MSTCQSSLTAVKFEAWHKDHLGSIAATTDHTGALTARYAYDPFGKRRLSDGNYDATGTLVVDWSPAVNKGTDRGYTGHEHLDDVDLVHMNGRVFDPTLGVFLQADSVMQDPLNLQNYNHYGYCFNNPLTCTDPSGFSWWTDNRRMVIGIAVAIVAPHLVGLLLMEAGGGSAFVVTSFGVFDGAVTGLSALGNFTAAAVSGFASGAVASGSFEGAVQGAFTAGIFYGAGHLIGGTGAFAGGERITDTFAQAAIHGVVGCVTSAAGGGKCGPGAMSAGFSKFATVNGFVGQDPVSGTITSAVIGGTSSALGGGKFANGAQTAAFGYLFNHPVHSAAEARATYGKGTVGHHWVPFGSTTDLDISVEARALWGQSTNGMSLPDSVHLPQHGAYNTAVRAELLDWSARNNVDLATMSTDDAKRFSLHVQSSSHPDISRIVGRINTFHSMPSTSRSLYRGLSAVGASGLVELFYPSPMRAPQWAINPNIAGC